LRLLPKAANVINLKFHPLVELFQKLAAEVVVTKEATVTKVPRLPIVITGVSAGLPGCNRQSSVFAEDNLERLVRGEQCIEPIPENVKQAMVEENVKQAMVENNVVRVTKLLDGTLK
jgi:hypothetical protein